MAVAAVWVVCLCWAAPSAAQRRGQGADVATASAEMELQKGTELTRRGQFQEAIPHLLAARGQVSNDYAVSFNLALCYVATSQYEAGTMLLQELRSGGHDTAAVENLLAQVYLGSGQPDQALKAAEFAAQMSPRDEKLYLLVAEACMDHGYYDVGIKVTELGLRNLPKSARLLFEHGVLLSQVDRLDDARKDFQRTAELAPGKDIAYIAAAQRSLFDGDVAEARRVAREGIEKASPHFMLLTIYGEAVLRSGIAPDHVEFADARAALEKAVADRPSYSSAQIALGKLYLLENRLDDALSRLEAGRRLDPRNPAVYSNLAAAYRRKGDAAQADAMLAILAQLNREEAERMNSASGDRKAGYASRIAPPPPKPPQQ